MSDVRTRLQQPVTNVDGVSCRKHSSSEKTSTRQSAVVTEDDTLGHGAVAHSARYVRKYDGLQYETKESEKYV